MIFVKDGVTPRLILLVCGLANIAEELDFPVTITSGSDGKHKQGSLHYNLSAVDIRTRGLSRGAVGMLLSALKEKFPQPDFDVILESDHIHLEDNRGK